MRKHLSSGNIVAITVKTNGNGSFTGPERMATEAVIIQTEI